MKRGFAMDMENKTEWKALYDISKESEMGVAERVSEYG